MNFVSIIERRRDRGTHSFGELEFLARGAADGSIPAYQLSAWLMAAYLNPLSLDETADLTRAMAESGETLDLAGLPKPWVDKHSTGGVGDKTTLVAMPVLAACGLTMVKMSGRGLGLTGGTIDKLSSVDGLRLDLSPAEMVAQAAQIGLALTGQSAALAPADKALYELRDVTGTVTSIPLIASSILCKKVAGGAEFITFDVKCGSGGLVHCLDSARELAHWLQEIGNRLGLKVSAEISDMSEPLGGACGNDLEVQEAQMVLYGDVLNPAQSRFDEFARRLCAHTLAFALNIHEDEARGRVDDVIAEGRAAEKWEQWLTAQGAASGRVPPKLAPVLLDLVTEEDGWLTLQDAAGIGRAVLELGGGRKTKEDPIDPRVGVCIHRPIGSRFNKGEPFATIHAADEDAAAKAAKSLAAAFEFSATPVPEVPLFLSPS